MILHKLTTKECHKSPANTWKLKIILKQHRNSHFLVQILEVPVFPENERRHSTESFESGFKTIGCMLFRIRAIKT